MPAGVRVYSVTDDPAFYPTFVHSCVTTGIGDATDCLQFVNEDALEAWQLANTPEIPLLRVYSDTEAADYQHGRRPLPGPIIADSGPDLQTWGMVAIGGLLLWRLLGRR